MFRKLLPLIVILALIAAYASYRAVAAQSGPAGVSTYSSWTSRYTRAVEHGKAYVPNTGGTDELKSDTSPSSGDVQQAKSTPVKEYTNRWRR